MLHACVERFDVAGTVGKILGTKRGLSLPSDKHRMVSKIDAGSQELLGRGARCRVWWFESSVEWSSRRTVHFTTPRHHFKHGVNAVKNWCAVITSVWTIRRGKRRYSFNRGEQSLPSDIHRMGSKIFADVDWVSAHGAAGVSYIEISEMKNW